MARSLFETNDRTEEPSFWALFKSLVPATVEPKSTTSRTQRSLSALAVKASGLDAKGQQKLIARLYADGLGRPR